MNGFSNRSAINTANHRLLRTATLALAFLVSAPSWSWNYDLDSTTPTNVGDFTLTWVPNGVGQYKLQEREEGGSTWTTILTTSSATSSHTITNQPSGAYEYRIDHYYQDCSGGGRRGGCTWVDDYSNTLDISVITPVTQLVSLDGSFDVWWEAVNGTVVYKVEESVDGGAWSQVYAGGSTSTSLSGRSTGTHEYRLITCDDASCTSPTNPSEPTTIEVEITSPLYADSIGSTTAVGDLPFSASVDRAGNSTIVVPLRLPPGVNDFEPNLTLSYSSGASPALGEMNKPEGVLGYGWALSGVPEIRRCRVGTAGEIAYDSTDRLCLNGNALVLVDGSDYWTDDDAEYRTEIDIHARIVAGGTGLANRYFTVTYKNGNQTIFGDTDSSQLISPDADVNPSGYPYLWSPSVSTDNFGNEIVYTWKELDSIGTNFLTKVEYGDAEVELRYRERCESQSNCDTTSVQYGENMKGIKGRAVVLNRILTKVSTNTVNDYRLDHEYQYGYLRLEAIQHCAYDEAGSTQKCLEPIALSWDLLAIDDPSASTSLDLLVVDEITNSFGDSTYFNYEVIAGYAAGSDHALHVDAPSYFWPFSNYTGSFPGTGVLTIERALVSSIQHPDGDGGLTTTSFFYTGYPLYSSEGRGYLGFPFILAEFENKRIFDPATSITYTGIEKVRTEFKMEFPYFGRIAGRRVDVDTDPLASFEWTTTFQANWTYDENTTYSGAVTFPYLATATTQDYEPTSSGSVGYGGTVKKTFTYCFHDVTSGSCSGSGTTYEVPTQLEVKTEKGVLYNLLYLGADHTETQTFDYSNISSTWLNGFIEKLTVEWTDGTTTLSEATDFARDLSTHNKAGTIQRFANHSVYDQTTNIEYDSYGNVSSTEELGIDMPTIDTAYSSYLNNLYPQTVTNSLSQATGYGYDERFGTVDSVTDANGRTSTTTRDEFGRVISEVAIDGTKVTTSYDDCSSGCSAVTWAVPRLRITKSYTHNSTSVQIAPEETYYLDSLGNIVLTEREAFSSSDGQVRIQRRYDAEGNMIKESLPYFSTGGTAKFADTYYDFKGRAIVVSKPDLSTVETTIYSDGGTGGHVNVEVEESGTGRKKRSRFNMLGQLVETTDGYGTSDAVTTLYTYTVRGDLDAVTVDGELVADMDYDDAGNRDELWEPGSGTTDFSFYSNHWLKDTTDDSGRVIRYEYDELGRLVNRYDDYGQTGEITNSWTWGTVSGEIGYLISRDNGTQFEESYSYDTAGRLETVSADIDVSSFSDNNSYVIEYGYDSSSRLTTIDYPNGLTITNVYTTNGYLSQVKKGTTVLQEYTDVDAFGNVIGEEYGNGIQTARSFDPETGRLTYIQTGSASLPKSVQDLVYNWRTDGSLYKRKDFRGTGTTADDFVEEFTYDSVSRLKIADTAATGRTLTNTYDDFGNILGKTSDVSGDLDVSSYSYTTGTNPYKLNSVTIGGISNTLYYDSVGNIEQYDAATGDDTWISYDAGNRVSEIVVGASETTTTPTAKDEFWYGPDNQRFLRKSSWMDSSTLKVSWTLYLQGGVFEEVHPEHDSSVDYVQRVLVTANVQHQYIKYPSSSDEKIDYLHRDHLGSIVNSTNESGTAENTVVFDPFGMQRDTGWGTDISAAALATIGEKEDTYTGRGFTDHEMLNRTGFVHMNGRVFDQRLGRFIQPDPIVGIPSLGQNFNRYAYVFNNPMSATDPSGFDCSRESCGDWGGWIVLPGEGYDLSRHPTAPDWDPLGLDQAGPGNYWDEQSPLDPPEVLETIGEYVWDFSVGDTISSGVETYGHIRNGDWKAAAMSGAMLGCDIAKACKAVSKIGGKFLKKIGERFFRRGVPDRPSTLHPGPNARESISGHRGPPTAAEQRQVNDIMQRNGCHTCGTTNPGTKSGNAIADHQPPQALGEPKEFYPHCLSCSRRQGGEVLQETIRRQSNQ